MNPINTAVLLVLFVGCVFAGSVGFNSERIIGGEDAVAGQFPHQVSMRRKMTKSHFCGGSIIAPRIILTAAHCTQDDDLIPENLYVVVGALHLRDGGIEVYLDKILVHEEFEITRLRNDISLLHTTQEMVYSESVKPIALPTELPPAEGGLAVTMSGWGFNTYPPPPDASPLPNTLQFAPTETLSDSECRSFNVSDTSLCTINPKGRGACRGDSGGPLISNDNNLVGVASGVLEYCALGYPDIYTDVYLFRDWIYGQIDKLGEDPNTTT